MPGGDRASSASTAAEAPDAVFAERHPWLTLAVLQVAGWSLFFTVQYLSLLGRLRPEERAPFGVLEAIMAATAPLVSTTLHFVYRPLLSRRIPGGAAGRAVLALAAMWAAAQLWVAADGWVIQLVVAYTPVRFDWTRVTGLMSGSYFVMLLTWTAAWLAIRFWWQLQARERAMLQYKLSARDAQLRALAYQLNPHFLFNALNSLRALILEDRDRAREMVTRLAGFLRQALAAPSSAENPLSAEVSLLRSYLAIEQVRFDDKLFVKWDVGSEALSVTVPSLILQPLVENAIRHGIERDGRLDVYIGAQLRDGLLTLTVRNSGTLNTDGVAPTGVGLANVRARLEHVYPGRHSVSIRSADGHVSVEVSITQ